MRSEKLKKGQLCVTTQSKILRSLYDHHIIGVIEPGETFLILEDQGKIGEWRCLAPHDGDVCQVQYKESTGWLYLNDIEILGLFP